MRSFHHAQACSEPTGRTAAGRWPDCYVLRLSILTCPRIPSSQACSLMPACPFCSLPWLPQSSSTRALPEPCQCPQAHCEAFSDLSFWVPPHLPGAPLPVLIVEWGSAPSPTWGQGACSGLPSAALDHAGQWRSESPCLTRV